MLSLLLDEGDCFQTTETGTITITRQLPNGSTVPIVQQTLGTITYEHDGGSIAYSRMVVRTIELYSRGNTVGWPDRSQSCSEL